MEAKKKKLQLRKETMAMLEDPQMHGINGGGTGLPGLPSQVATCPATCAVTCVANCTATIQHTCEGRMCGTGTFCDPNASRGCSAASGLPGVGDNTASHYCGNTGSVLPPGGGTC